MLLPQGHCASLPAPLTTIFFLHFLLPSLQATAAAEDALEAHKLLKSREENMDAELFAANSKVEQLSSALLAAQQAAAEAKDRAAEAEEQSKQVRHTRALHTSIGFQRIL
jgi:hypothetical protein